MTLYAARFSSGRVVWNRDCVRIQMDVQRPARSFDAHLSRWVRDRQLATNPLRQKVGDFNMTRNGFRTARLRVLPKPVFFALSPQYAAMPPKMPEECGADSSDHN